MSAILLYFLLAKATITSFSGSASLPVLREDLVVHRHVLTDAQVDTAVSYRERRPDRSEFTWSVSATTRMAFPELWRVGLR